jgi:hypothetical protein
MRRITRVGYSRVVAQTARSPRDLAVDLLSGSGAATAPMDVDVPAFLAWVAGEGIAGLLHARVDDTGAATRMPPALVDGLRAAAHRQAAVELVRRVELTRVVAAATSRGLEMLLMKGASLAYDVYPDPSWRPRSDVDLLIRADDRAAFGECLDALGYACQPEVSGNLVAYQFHAERTDGHGIRHLCDVHWKIANPQRFANALRFEELAQDAVGLPLLGPDARGLGRVHALWLACVHRAAHHYDHGALPWLFDIHFLLAMLTADDRQRFVALVERTGVRRICRRALLLARERCGTVVAPEVLAAFDAAPDDEPSAVFLDHGMRQIDVLWDDLRVLPGWGQRMMLLKEHLVPAPEYMRRSYAPGSSAPLPWLYVRRVLGGASKWLRR